MYYVRIVIIVIWPLFRKMPVDQKPLNRIGIFWYQFTPRKLLYLLVSLNLLKFGPHWLSFFLATLYKGPVRRLHFLKGEVSPTTMWTGWVERNFTNPTVKVWAYLDNPFKISDYAKLCMSPSLDRTLPEYVISQEDNPPLTLYIDFHNFFLLLLGYQWSFGSISFIKACTFISALTYM